jgi:dUTPase
MTINNLSNHLNQLLNIYDRVMILKLFVDDDSDELKYKYLNAANKHNNKLLTNPHFIDAGFDLFAPGNTGNELNIYGDILRFFSTGWQDAKPVNKVDFKVCCSAIMVTDNNKSFNTGYYMYPRSSLSKTQLRLANSTGIIDAGYRGHLMGMFDVVNVQPNHSDDREADYFGSKFDRYLQICAPGLVPILVEIVNTKEDLGEETERGNGGFGSTGR